MWYWLCRHVLVGPAVRLFTRPRVSGAALPSRGPVVVVANHLAEIDSLVLALVCRRRLTFLAKSEYFTGRGLRGAARRWFYSAAGQVAVDRRGGDRAEAALDTARQVVRSGRVWAVYPEGTRSPDRRLYRAHTGVARVALSVPGAVVVPVGLAGTQRADPPNRRGWRPARVSVSVGEPVDLSAWDGRADDPAAWRECADRISAEIGGLTGQEYVDRYPSAEERRRRDERR